MDQGVVKIQKLCHSLLGSEIWQPPWGRICGQNPAWGADPFPQGDLTLGQLAVFLCEMGVPGTPWKSSRPPHSFFSPPPPSTPCSTDPPTPTSIKPLPHIPSVHTAHTASPANTPRPLGGTPGSPRLSVSRPHPRFPSVSAGHRMPHLPPLLPVLTSSLFSSTSSQLTPLGSQGLGRLALSCHRQESSQPACACLFSHSQSKTEDGKELAVSPISGNCKNSCLPSWNDWRDQCWLYWSHHHPAFPLTLPQAFPTLLQMPLPCGARGWHLSHPVHYKQSLRVGDPTEVIKGNERGELVWSCLTRSLDNLNIC